MGLTIPLNTLVGALSKVLFLLGCSATVRPRRPFGKDPELTYDFEVDSEDEWEDEAEGENLSVSHSTSSRYCPSLRTHVSGHAVLAVRCCFPMAW